MRKTCPGPKRIFPWRGGAKYFRANNININVDIMFVEQYGKKKLALSTYIFQARPGAEYFSANNININVEQYGKKTCPGPAFFRARGGTIFQPEKTKIFYHEKKKHLDYLV